MTNKNLLSSGSTKHKMGGGLRILLFIAGSATGACLLATTLALFINAFSSMTRTPSTSIGVESFFRKILQVSIPMGIAFSLSYFLFSRFYTHFCIGLWYWFIVGFAIVLLSYSISFLFSYVISDSSHLTMIFVLSNVFFSASTIWASNALLGRFYERGQS